MSVTSDEVRRIATLARLELPEEAIEPLAGELSAILGYVDTLAELELDDVPAFTHALDRPTPLRADEVGPGLSPEEALGQAPRRDGTSFVVPKVVG